MKFKKPYILFVVVLLIPIILFAQVRVGDFNISMYKFNKLKKKTVNQFKDKTTKFILPDFYSKEEYENILKEVWDVTPYEVILLKDFDENQIKEGDALAQFVSRYYSRSGGMDGATSYRYFCFLDFMVVDGIKKKQSKNKLKWDVSRIGAIYFNRDISFDLPFSLIYYKDGDDFFPPVGKKEYLSNFRLGYLKNYFQLMNRSIKNEESRDIYDDFINPELKNLKKSILYIINKPFESLMKNYSYKYELVDYEKIEEMIMNKGSLDFYYLTYIQIHATKVTIIVNGKTGNIVYQNKEYTSNKAKEKDIKNINSAIKKLNK